MPPSGTPGSRHDAIVIGAGLCFPIPFFAPQGSGHEAQKVWFQRIAAALARLPRAATLMKAELRPSLRHHLKHAGLVNLLSQMFPDGASTEMRGVRTGGRQRSIRRSTRQLLSATSTRHATKATADNSKKSHRGLIVGLLSCL